MKLTFIGHSGISLEWEKVNFVFDYFKGEIPEMDKNKKLFVFSSHDHGDHFNPEIFSIFKDFCDVTYVLSQEIGENIDKNRKKYGVSDDILKKIVYVQPEKTYDFTFDSGSIQVETFASTDLGVAFMVSYGGKNIYHAGDLHWWAWPENEPEYDKWMKDTFFSQVKRMEGKTIDLAFAPVDLRLEENVFLGADALMRRLDIKRLYPIHMFGGYDITKKLRENEISLPYRDKIYDFDYDGESFLIEL